MLHLTALFMFNFSNDYIYGQTKTKQLDVKQL